MLLEFPAGPRCRVTDLAVLAKCLPSKEHDIKDICYELEEISMPPQDEENPRPLKLPLMISLFISPIVRSF